MAVGKIIFIHMSEVPHQSVDPSLFFDRNFLSLFSIAEFQLSNINTHFF